MSILPEEGMREKRLPKRAREVQNKAPAPQQITAEQLLRESHEMQLEREAAPPRQQITSPEELELYKQRKRREFENNIRRNRLSVGTWLKYATFEEQLKEFERARSIYERLIDINYTNASIWLKYAEMEMRHKFINRARNVWDRAVALLPRVDQLWYKYALMEESLKNYDGARRIFERWMKWNPDEKAWERYIKLEMRMPGLKKDKVERCRKIYERFINAHVDIKSYLMFARWEVKNGLVQRARRMYERCMTELGEKFLDASFYREFARLEVRAKEYDRARTIYKYALDHVSKDAATDIFEEYMGFEKQYGDLGAIDAVILNKRRFEYESELESNSLNYDVWFDYIKLEEQNGNQPDIREIYERSVSNPPPISDKRYWKRYIYLWIKYALFEELVSKDYARCEEVYNTCLKLIPHNLFTFGKIWLYFAHFYVRRKQLSKARSVLGRALGMCPKKNIFVGYIALEHQLGEFGRCRKLYDKYLETFSTDTSAWINYAKLETRLLEFDRARGIYELGIQQDGLDAPEQLWRAYIDFEIGRRAYPRVRALFDRLLKETKHVRVWISFAQFEGSVNEINAARKIFERGNKYFKETIEAHGRGRGAAAAANGAGPAQGKDMELVTERVMLLEAWEQFEQQWGDEQQIAKVRNMQPRRVKKRRPMRASDGTEAGWEEYYDYIFRDEGASRGNMKLLERARMWKLQQEREQREKMKRQNKEKQNEEDRDVDMQG